MRMTRLLTGFKNTEDSFLKRSGLTLTSEVGQEQKQQTQVFVRFGFFFETPKNVAVSFQRERERERECDDTKSPLSQSFFLPIHKVYILHHLSLYIRH